MKTLSDFPSGTPVSLIAEFTALPGNEDAVAELLAGLAGKVRSEDGNVAFDCYRRLENTAKFVVYEIYRDKAAFDIHIGAAYGAEFNAKLRALIVEPNSILTFLTPLGAS